MKMDIGGSRTATNKQNINNQTRREIKMSQQQQRRDDNERRRLAPLPTSADQRNGNNSNSKQPAAVKLIKKAHVRFDDYLDLNEENMRRSCKRLMNRLYCEPGASANQPAPASPLAAECKQQAASLMTMAADRQSVESAGDQKRSSAGPARKSYLRSQYERRQERQMMSLMMLRKKMQEAEAVAAAPANKLSSDQQQSAICLADDHQLFVGANGLAANEQAAGARAAPKTKPATATGEEDLVAKSHELSKRRFFEKLERRESMRNSLIVSCGGGASGLKRSTTTTRRAAQQQQQDVQNEDAKRKMEQSRSANEAADRPEQQRQAEPLASSSTTANNSELMLKLYQTLGSADNPILMSSRVASSSPPTRQQAVDKSETREGAASGQAAAAAAVEQLSSPLKRQQNVVEAATQLGGPTCLESIVRSNELIGFRTQLPVADEQEAAKTSGGAERRRRASELSATARCIDGPPVECQAESSSKTMTPTRPPPTLIEFARRQNGLAEESYSRQLSQLVAAEVGGQRDAGGSSDNKAAVDEFENAVGMSGNKKEAEVAADGANDESQFEIKISTSQLLMIGRQSSAGKVSLLEHREDAASTASQLVVMPMEAAQVSEARARRACGRQAAATTATRSNQSRQLPIDQLNACATQANLMNNSDECDLINDDKSRAAAESQPSGANLNERASRATTSIENANKKVQLNGAKNKGEETMESVGGPASRSTISSERANNSAELAEIKLNPAPGGSQASGVASGQQSEQQQQQESREGTAASGKMIKNTMPSHQEQEEEDSPTHPVDGLFDSRGVEEAPKRSTAQRVALLAAAATTHDELSMQQVEPLDNDYDSVGSELANLNLRAEANADARRLSVGRLAKTKEPTKSLITPPRSRSDAAEQRIRDVLPEANHDEQRRARNSGQLQPQSSECNLTAREHEQPAAAAALGLSEAASINIDKEPTRLESGEQVDAEKREWRRAQDGPNDQLVGEEYANPSAPRPETMVGGNKVEAEDHDHSGHSGHSEAADSHLINCGNFATGDAHAGEQRQQLNCSPPVIDDGGTYGSPPGQRRNAAQLCLLSPRPGPVDEKPDACSPQRRHAQVSEEDRGSSCSSSGFGASISGVTTSSSSASSSSDSNSIKEKTKQLPDYSNLAGNYPKRFSYKRIESTRDDDSWFYDAMELHPDAQFQQHFCGHVLASDHKLVGPDESYPGAAASPLSSWSLMIENLGYASSAMLQPDDGEKALPTSGHYANLAPPLKSDQAVEYATVRPPAADFRRLSSEQTDEPTRAPASLSGSSYSSSTSGGFSRLQPICCYANKTAAACELHLAANSGARSLQLFSPPPVGQNQSLSLLPDDGNSTAATTKATQEQQAKVNHAKSTSLLKRFGSLVSKAFASGGSNGTQMSGGAQKPSAAASDTTEQVQVAADGKLLAESHEVALMRPLDSIDRPANVIEEPASGRTDGVAGEQNVASATDGADSTTQQHKTRAQVDLVILPAKNNQTAPQALNQSAATRRPLVESPTREHKMCKPTNTKDERPSRAKDRRTREQQQRRRRRRAAQEGESHLDAKSTELLSFVSQSLSSLSSGSLSCVESSAVRCYSSLIAAPVGQASGRDEAKRTPSGSPVRRASSLSEELESLMSRSDSIDMDTKGAKLRDSSARKEFDDHWTANSTTTTTRKAGDANRRRIDIDCVSPTKTAGRSNETQQEAASHKQKSRSSLLRWFSSTTTNADDRQQHHRRGARPDREQSGGTEMESLLFASQPMSGVWSLAGSRQQVDGRKKPLKADEKIYEIIESREPRRDGHLVDSPRSLNVYATPANHKSSARQQTERYDKVDGATARCQSLSLMRNYVRRRQESSKLNKPTVCHHRSQHHHHHNHHHRRDSAAKHRARHERDRDPSHFSLTLLSSAGRTKRCAASSCSSLDNYEPLASASSKSRGRQRGQQPTSCCSKSANCCCCCSKCAKEADAEQRAKRQVWGQLIKISKSDGSQVIELQRAQGRSWGFFVARGAIDNEKGIFISRMHDAVASSSLAGLISIGDRILSIDGHTVGPDHDLLRVNQLISNKSKISLKVKPFRA